MYFIGYVGYYGILMMVVSYDVFFIFIVVYVFQFVFLVFVENFYIEKIYNLLFLCFWVEFEIGSQIEVDVLVIKEFNGNFDIFQFVYNMIGSFDFFRVIDVFFFIIVVCFIVLMVVIFIICIYQILVVVNVIFWCFWYFVGLGYILKK